MRYLKSVSEDAFISSHTFELQEIEVQPNISTCSYVFQSVSAKWIFEAAWTLSDISSSIKSAQPTVIFGPTGCGKSTLLHAIVGEVPYLIGDINVNRNLPIGYCNQTPWLLSGTIRDNIVGLSKEAIDPHRYAKALQFSDLKSELEHFTLGIAHPVKTIGYALVEGKRPELCVYLTCRLFKMTSKTVLVCVP